MTNWDITQTALSTEQVIAYLNDINQLRPELIYVEFGHCIKRLHSRNKNIYSGDMLGACVVYAEKNFDTDSWDVKERNV